VLSSLSPRRRVFIGTLLAIGAATLAVVGVRALAPDARARGVPVVLIHGFGGTPASLGTLASRLESAGHEVIVVALPDNGVGPIDRSAAALERAVDESGAEQVDIVAHSIGGVVARFWLRYDDGARRTRHVVTLGSPHHGAQLALAGAASIADCTGACAQVLPGSGLLADLNADDETPDGPSYVTIWTSVDATVTPPESATLDGAVNIRLQDLCPDTRTSHGGLVRDSLPISIVLRALGGEPAAGSAPCPEA
jgi:triacylglycerol esterase/lipase EstA (alpha/beta hydrolase family)